MLSIDTEITYRTEAELAEDRKIKTHKERTQRLTRDRQKGGSERLKAVGIKKDDPTLVADEEFGIINLRRVKSLKDFQ